MIPTPRIVIVGAGISGLSLAYGLQKILPNASITILEGSDRTGGLIGSHRVDEFLVEQGPAMIHADHHASFALCSELNLTPRLIPALPGISRREILHDGHLYPFPSNTWGLLTSPLIGFDSLFRLFFERFRPRSPARLDESIFHFAQRRVGRHLAEFIADSAATDLFAGDSRLLSIRSCLPHFARAEDDFGSVSRGLARVLKQSKKGFPSSTVAFRSLQGNAMALDQGMQTLTDRLAEALKHPVQLRTRVRRLERSPEHPHVWIIRDAENRVWQADAVVLTCPVPTQAALFAELDADLADALLTIPYSPLLVLSLGFPIGQIPRRVKAGTVLVPQRFQRHILRIEISSLQFPQRAPDGCHLVRVVCAGWHHREMIHWDDDQIIAIVRKELRQLLGIQKPPKFLRLTRWPQAIPQLTLGHEGRIRNIKQLVAQHPGLFIAGQAFAGTSVNDCILESHRLSKRIMKFLANPTAILT